MPAQTISEATVRAGVGLPALMKLLGQSRDDYAYVDVAGSDLQREFPLARIADTSPRRHCAHMDRPFSGKTRFRSIDAKGGRCALVFG
jgi:hypothetical protein